MQEFEPDFLALLHALEAGGVRFVLIGAGANFLSSVKARFVS